MTTTTTTAELVERLRRLDVCSVSDALDAYAISSVVLGVQPVWPYTGVVAGQVRTITAGPRRSDRPAGHIAAAAVDDSGPEHVLVIANGGRLDVSCWGGILSAAAVGRGIAGTLVDGACRDATEAARLEYPVYARRVVPVSARGRVVQLAMDEPIEFGGVTVNPGDLVIADTTGVAFVPCDRAGQVIALAAAITAREIAMTEAVRGGRPVSEVMHDSQFPTPDRTDE